MKEQLGIKHLIDIPEDIAPYEIRPHTNGWGEHVIYLKDQHGKTYIVDFENRQLVRAIAPVGLF